MEKKIHVVSIIIEDMTAVDKVNQMLHKYADSVVGRMGIPYPSKGVHIISVVLDASNNDINALAGTLGRIHGVASKAL